MLTMKQLNDFEVISIIGSGSFGTCFKVRDKNTHEIFAWKAVDYNDLSDAKKESLLSEIKVLRQLDHPNIVQYYDHILNKETQTLYIIMECCEGGDLSHLIAQCRTEKRRFEEAYIWRVLYQVCRALHVCHTKMDENTILHRDIKPANIFLDAEGNAKLGDFGLARVLKRDQSFAESFVGTPYYMSPEIVKGSKYDRKSDVWAVGCLIYEMCALRPPFQGRRLDQLTKNIACGKFVHIPTSYSPDLQDVISFMLEVNSERRPNIEVLLRHPVLIRNIEASCNSNKFPTLVGNYQSPPAKCRGKSLDFSPNENFSSTILSQFTLSAVSNRRISGVSTPLLRSELFGTTKPVSTSDSDLYETIRYENETVRPAAAVPTQPLSPAIMTQNIFEEVLETRLHAIRAQEALLKQKEANLLARERELNEREKRLNAAEKLLEEKSARIVLGKPLQPQRRSKCKPLDDTYCTVEPNETLIVPTVAKLDLARMPPPRTLHHGTRRVTFKSPKKFTKYDIENIPPPDAKKSEASLKSSLSSRSSISSKASDESDHSHKRKSILSIFGLNSNKSSKDKKENLTKLQSSPEPASAKADTDLTQKWTIENKRAAFDMLAAMNAADRRAAEDDNEFNMKTHRQRLHRQSVRERQVFQRNRHRRSLIA